MTSLAWITFLVLCLADGMGRIPTTLSHLLVGFLLSGLVAGTVRALFCALLREDNVRLLLAPALMLLFVPHAVALAFFASTIYWYCIGFGFIAGIGYWLYTALRSFGQLCQEASDALIQKHSDIGAFGG